MLTQENIAELKRKLEEDGSAIEREIKDLEKGVPEFGTEGINYEDSEEEADEAEEFSTNMGISQTLRERAALIRSALQRIESGKYGQCEKCGKEIGLDLLKINPESRLCESCKLADRK